MVEHCRGAPTINSALGSHARQAVKPERYLTYWQKRLSVEVTPMSDDNDGLDDFDKTLASLGAVPPKETPPWTVVPSKPYGDAELAADMAIMLNGRLTVTDAMGLIRQYGPLKAQLAAKRLAKGDFASIENLPMALRSAIESGHQVPGEQKTAPRTQNQANSSSNGQSFKHSRQPPSFRGRKSVVRDR